MAKFEWHEERGQSLIQFSLMLIVLLLFVSLSVDGGNVYSERRKMQNAADAAALAGARELCLGSSQATITAKARDYLIRNGVVAAQIAGGDITVQDNKVIVKAREIANTILAGLIGFDTIDVAATAKGVCGASTAACGLWPVAFDYPMYVGVQCGQSMVIWDADNDEDEIACEIGGVPRDICSCYDCDLDNNGSNDFAVMTKLARGWMDFPSTSDPVYTDSCKASGCGASELACRIESNYGGRVTLPACIAGLRGVKAGVKDEVDDRTGDLVQIPLYTAINCASGSNCSGSEASSYYITKFGCVSVGGWVQKLTLDPKPGMPKSYKKISTKAILATKDCSNRCMSFCGSASDTPAQPWELRAASLSQ